MKNPKNSDIDLANYKLTDDLTFISCIIRHMNIEGINFWFAFFTGRVNSLSRLFLSMM